MGTVGGMADVGGTVAAGYESVRDAFADNFDRHGDVGASLCVYRRGEVVVDLWGGVADVPAGRPYSADTLQLVFSTTKGMSAICVHMLVERGRLDLDSPVARYWPEFAANGKADISVRQLLSHVGGLAAIDEPTTVEEFLAFTPVTERLAAQRPNWDPGSARGYHAITFGHLAGELVRRVDGRSLGAFFAQEIVGPLDLDAYIGLPERLESRVAPLIDFAPTAEMSEFMTAILTPGTMTNRAFMNPPILITSFNERPFHAAEIPAVNCITNARSLARAYAACVGTIDGVRLLASSTVESASKEHYFGPDLVLVDRAPFGNAAGFMLPDTLTPLLGAGSFGHPGMGGSLAFGHPGHEVGFGYVMNQCIDFNGAPDPRTTGVTEALANSLSSV
jgi:CubicO group peptidase (beta-lactamase class C family)